LGSKQSSATAGKAKNRKTGEIENGRKRREWTGKMDEEAIGVGRMFCGVKKLCITKPP
jgi:hypothetical protein